MFPLSIIAKRLLLITNRFLEISMKILFLPEVLKVSKQSTQQSWQIRQILSILQQKIICYYNTVSHYLGAVP